MHAKRVLEILSTLRSGGVSVSVDGGWGVDALVGHQTRPHEDLDLVVALDATAAVTRALGRVGFAVVDDQLPVRFVMRDANGAQLDFHTVRFDAEGGGVQPQPGGGSFRYPPEGFVRGRIGGKDVPCISAPIQILCHLGYEPARKDRHDVLLLCRRFDLRVPPAYRDRPNVPMSTAEIQVATPEQLAALRSLVAGFRDHLGATIPSDADLAARLPAALADPNIEFGCAIGADGAPLGYTQTRFFESIWSGGIEALLEDLFVVSDARETGLGGRLLDHALARAKHRGARAIALHTNERNGAAIRLYTAAGFALQSEAIWSGGREIRFTRKLR